MPQTLPEYLDWLAGQADLLWPQPPAAKPLKAVPAIAPLPGVRAVTWNPYGTLLRIDTGRLHLVHPQELRLQIALQKTIEEFKLWTSMTRKPGPPWESLLPQYIREVEDARLRSNAPRGETPEAASAAVWRVLLERVIKNGYTYDASQYGDVSELSLKVAYFFHACQQGVAAREGAAETLQRLIGAGLRVGLIGDGQGFTSAQLLRALRVQRSIEAFGDVLTLDAVTLSGLVGVRPPSASLYLAAAERLARLGIAPGQVLHISVRLEDDLVPARKAGFRTALFAADAQSTHVEKSDLRDPEKRPDRLLTEVRQILTIVGT